MATRQRLARVRLLSIAVAASTLLGSLSLPPPVMAAPDFQILISPSSQLLPPDGSVSFQINLGAIDGFDEPVTLSVGDLPAGVSSLLSDDEVVPPASVTLTLVAASDAEIGTFDLVVTAVGGGITHAATGAVTVDFGLVPKCFGYFQGTVTDLETGAPIEGVDILGQLTDENGHWGPVEIGLGDNNSPVTTAFFVQPDGYWPTLAEGTAFCDQTTEVDVRLLPWHPATVVGTVVEGTPDENDPSIVIPTGPALEGVLVSTQFYPGPPINTQDFSGADGSYRIDLAHVNPGNEPVENVDLSAVLDGYWGRSFGSPSPLPIGDIEADQEVEVQEFGLVRQCTVAVSGSVVFSDTGQPAAGVLVDAAHEDEFKRTETDEEGRFSLPAVLLAYNNQPTDLGVSAAGTDLYFGDSETVPLTVCGAEIAVELVLAPRPFGSLEGYVFDEETNEPVEGVLVGPLSGCGPCTSTGPTNADGYYRIDRIPLDFGPAEFVILTHHIDYWPGSSTVEIVAGETARLDLDVLRRKFAHVQGQVTDAITGLPIEGATVGFPVTVTTDANGEYQSGPLDVGHRNAALETGFRAGAAGYWPQDQAVTLHPDETAQLDYALIPVCDGASVRGTVVDAVTHEPIEGASVFTSGGGSIVTGADGTYLIEGIPVGTNNSPIEVRVTASAEGYYSQTRSITVFCAGSFTIDFGPEPPMAELEGYVTCNGEPIEGAFVGSEFGSSTSTDAAGYYFFDEVPLNADGSSRTWQITVSPDGRPEQVKPATVVADTRTRLDFAFCDQPGSPQISVSKTSRVDSIPEPGGDVTFDVTIGNEGSVDVALTGLTDNRFGNLDGQGTCDLPQTVAVGAAYECSFSGSVTGDAGAVHTNVVTACGSANGLEDCETAEESVQVTDVPPTLVVTKEANPSVLFDPGGTVTFIVSVTNTSGSSDPVELTSLTDSVFGDIADTNPLLVTECDVPQTLDPAASYQCSFTADISGQAGSTHTNVVTACVADDEGNAECAEASATVTINQVAQLTPTGTECSDFASGVAADQDELRYQLKGTKINAVNPGVFLYWSAIEAPATAFELSVHQSAVTVEGLPASPPHFNVNESPRLFDAACERVKSVRLQRTARGQVTLSVSGAVPGEQYYLTVKYDSQSIVSTVVSLNPGFEAVYAFGTHIDGAAAAAAADSLVLRRR